MYAWRADMPARAWRTASGIRNWQAAAEGQLLKRMAVGIHELRLCLSQL